MAFTAQDVKELREITGCGMMDCKKALTEADGDKDKAVEILREKGLASATKKASRIAAEGIVKSYIDGGVGVLVEVNSETDFVAKNEEFQEFVGDVANSAIEAAKGMKNMTDVSDLIEPKIRHIPGVGYVSPETDDPVVVATVENIESVGVIAGAMIGAALGNKNTYLVKRGTTCNVLPGSVIFSATAFMNGNVIDLAVPFENKTRILR